MNPTCKLLSINNKKNIIKEFENKTQIEFSEMESQLYAWVNLKRKNRRHVITIDIQAKSISISTILYGDNGFKASYGWTNRFKDRHSIRNLKITGEKLWADENAAKERYTFFPGCNIFGNLKLRLVVIGKSIDMNNS
ncbi:hypothetical protein A3Q56_03698 [Intoshia linei]|uniref:HTH CENPB-type domain-containing protein n=1 Tax=Intoshia linei TaxID=1819745 RepID=A0A177B4S6_9BILA|nr:hypothetical protein A3Q56_03698 [Intoshia linei]